MSFIGDITNIVLGVSGLLQQIDDMLVDASQLVENSRLEVRRLKEFKFDPKFRTRVINAPRAIEQSRDFVADIADQATEAFRSLVSNLKAIKFSAGHLGAPEKGGSGVLKILEDITKIKLFIGEIDAFFKALESFVDAIRQIHEELATLETIFLPQGNLRKVERLADGGTIKIRLGSLHS
jgi:hypothetical protein